MPEKVLRMSVAWSDGGHELAPAGCGFGVRPGVVVGTAACDGRATRQRLGAPGRLPLAVLDQPLGMAGVLDAWPARRG